MKMSRSAIADMIMSNIRATDDEGLSPEEQDRLLSEIRRLFDLEVARIPVYDQTKEKESDQEFIHRMCAMQMTITLMIVEMAFCAECNVSHYSTLAALHNKLAIQFHGLSAYALSELCDNTVAHPN